MKVLLSLSFDFSVNIFEFDGFLTHHNNDCALLAFLEGIYTHTVSHISEMSCLFSIQERLIKMLLTDLIIDFSD